MISTIQYTLAFISSFVDRMFAQSMNFYEKNYKVQPKVVAWKVVRGLMDMITRTNPKNITITKNNSPLFFSVQSIIVKST